AERRRDPVRLGVRALDERLVAELDRPLRHSARRRDVPAPGPRRAARFARPLELLDPLRLDPEPRVPAVELPRVVTTAPSRTEPTALEQGADDVAAVAQHVDRPPLRIGK